MQVKPKEILNTSNDYDPACLCTLGQIFTT